MRWPFPSAGVAHALAIDPNSTTQIATGDRKWLRDHSDNHDVREILNRGEES